jgi:hypothetical protein
MFLPVARFIIKRKIIMTGIIIKKINMSIFIRKMMLIKKKLIIVMLIIIMVNLFIKIKWLTFIIDIKTLLSTVEELILDLILLKKVLPKYYRIKYKKIKNYKKNYKLDNKL